MNQMKKHIFFIACALFLGMVFSSCNWHSDDTSISISDSGDEYEMSACYAKNKTRKVQRLLNSRLEESCNISFSHVMVDKEITLDDQTRFYLHSYPGELEIRIDKTENSGESFAKIQELCEDLKELLADD